MSRRLVCFQALITISREFPLLISLDEARYININKAAGTSAQNSAFEPRSSSPQLHSQALLVVSSQLESLRWAE